MFSVRIDEIGLDAFAETREELAVEVKRQLEMLWKEYALADDSELTASAQQVKRNLLAAFHAAWGASRLVVRHLFYRCGILGDSVDVRICRFSLGSARRQIGFVLPVAIRTV